MSWNIFRMALIALLITYVIQGFIRLLLDVLCMVRSGLRRLSSTHDRPLLPDALREEAEKPIAVLLAVRGHDAALENRLRAFLQTIDYASYRIYMACYGTDSSAARKWKPLEGEFARLRILSPNKKRGSNPLACLGKTYRAALRAEASEHIVFELFLIHDLTSTLHPLALKVLSHHAGQHALTQLPLFAVPDIRASYANGAWLDELVMTHWRTRVGQNIRGRVTLRTLAGTAWSRQAIELLADGKNGPAFSIEPAASRAQELLSHQGHQCILTDRVALTPSTSTTPMCPGTRTWQPIAMLDDEPVSFRAALLKTWAPRNLAATAVRTLILPGYAVVAYALAHTARIATDEMLRPLWPLLVAALSIATWHLVVRIGLVARLYGPTHGLLSLLHLPLVHLLRFCGGVLSLLPAREAAHTRATEATSPETDDAPEPTRLGDLLVARKLITREQLLEALLHQKSTGKQIGEMLIEGGHLQEEDLVFALAEQRDEKAIEIDPYATPFEVLTLVPRSLAERYRVFPLATEGQVVVLASDCIEGDVAREELSAILGRPVRFEWCSAKDFEFALAKAYERVEDEQIDLSERLGPRLVREGAVTEEQLATALRIQKREHRKLGEILVEMNCLSEEELNRFLPAREEVEKGHAA